MKEVYRSACPLDCYATCGLLIYKENDKVTSIKGDPQHPLTRGMVCSKAHRHLERLYSKDRILHPLLKKGSDWHQIGWDEALDTWAEKLHKTRERYGTTAVLHHDASGSNGILRKMGTRFFNIYGGVTVPEGSLCWASGIAAQALDFGGHQLHEWEDMKNSGTVILWGRDPGRTNVHLIKYLKKAAKNGAQIISINPVKVQTGVSDTRHVQPRPGTDGALALGMANVIIREKLVNSQFIQNHVQGYKKFEASVWDFTPEKASQFCGIPPGEISSLARDYANGRPASIWFGFGMQRYTNSGRTVRCIDALAAITGNIGISGGGANYVHQHWQQFFTDLSGKNYAKTRRFFPWPSLARHILEASNPPVKSLVVTRSNPVTQLPDTNKVLQAFRNTDFVVAIDFFLNDTAEEADLFLPCTTFMEEEDVAVSSWNNYVSYIPKVIDPLGESKSDLDIFTELAERMSLLEFGSFTPREWLEVALSQKTKEGIDLDRLKEGPARNPAAPEIAWAEHKFDTPSGKYELYSERAVQLGLEPVPAYISPESITGEEKYYPLHLITPHSKDTIHSQFWNLISSEKLGSLPEVEMHPETLDSTGLQSGDKVWIESPRGRIQGIAKATKDIRPGVARIYQGRWISQNGGVNFLTPDTVSDLGTGSCYYDCRCRIYTVE